MPRFLFCALLPWLVFSCARGGSESAATGGGQGNVSQPAVPVGVPPAAVLKAGEYPIWFQFSAEGGLVHLESIEDARLSAALVPWALAPHIRCMLAEKNELLAAVNRGGFLRFASWDGDGSPSGVTHAAAESAGIGLHYVSGGDFWRQYTVGAFFFFERQPAAMLYRDERFVDSGAALPSPRFWTLNPLSAVPLAINVPALEPFPPEEGWDADALHRGADGLWYFRVVKKAAAQMEIRLLRAESLSAQGAAASLGAFQNSSKPEPLLSAPAPLRALLSAAFGAGGGTAATVSPEFSQQRLFAGGGNAAATLAFAAFWDGEATQTGASRPPALAVGADGRGVYAAAPGIAGQTETEPPFKRFALPPLPEGFVYTVLGFAGDTLFAAWEEQEEYSIGAAGFVAIRMGWQ